MAPVDLWNVPRRTSLPARLVPLVLAAYTLLFPLLVYAAGGKPATKLVNVADPRHLQPGFLKFVVDLYNDNLILFGLLVVGVMAGMGAVLGFAFDRGMSLLGINLGKLDHHE